MAASRLITGLGIFVALTTSALASMPPKSMDLGTHAMSEAQLKGVYRTHFGKKRFDKVTFIRVENGKAWKACYEPVECPLLGCNLEMESGAHVIVYSYDPTGKDPYMANNVLRHEMAHEFFRWPDNHPHAQP